jgi:hypothetical protein
MKRIEVSTTNRTYCSWEGCCAFIDPNSISGNTAICPKCHQNTCSKCKFKGHPGECTPEIGLQNLWEKAEENKWQHCYKCRRMIERVAGCNHME